MKALRKYFDACKAAYRGAWRGDESKGLEELGVKYDADTGYNGVAAVDLSNKELVIASSGHVLFPQRHKPSTWFGFVDEWLKDTISALQIAYLQEEPYQYKSALGFAESIIEKEEYKGYEVTFVGHSMGAVLSELLNAEFNNRGVNAKSISFEGVGSGVLARKMFGDDVVENIKGSVYAYNLSPNFFTKLAGQEQIATPWIVDNVDSNSWFNFEHGIASFRDKFNKDGGFIHQVIKEEDFDSQEKGFLPSLEDFYKGTALKEFWSNETTPNIERETLVQKNTEYARALLNHFGENVASGVNAINNIAMSTVSNIANGADVFKGVLFGALSVVGAGGYAYGFNSALNTVGDAVNFVTEAVYNNGMSVASVLGDAVKASMHDPDLNPYFNYTHDQNNDTCPATYEVTESSDNNVYSFLEFLPVISN